MFQQVFGIVVKILDLHPSADASHILFLKNTAFYACVRDAPSQGEALNFDVLKE